MTEEKGCLVVSLDFEMMWGCHDWASAEGYGATHISHVREVIERLISLFEKYNVHATFAAVGMLMFNNKEELLLSLPSNRPSYCNETMSPYKPGFIEGISKDNEYLFFASDIIEKLNNQKGIEIGTHTFSHFYCWEKGQTVDQFDSDIKSAVDAAKQKNLTLQSIIFPKNNVSDNYLKVAAKYGLKAYRGNPEKFFNLSKNSLEAIVQRGLRLLDNYIPLTKTTYTYNSLTSTEGVMNIPASRFLRPYNHSLRWFENIKVARIKREILSAARNNKIYHLWWHPHNFGKDMNKNLKILEDILKFYSKCSTKYGMHSMTMSELADFIKTNN